jgi:hypothetical protein
VQFSGTEPTYLSEWGSEEISTDHISRFILNSSKGLAEITRSRPPSVQFIHESVKDFLLAGGGLGVVWPNLGSNICGESHEQSKNCCLTYTDVDAIRKLFVETLSETSSVIGANLRRETSDDFPFLEYAVQNVFYHSEIAQVNKVDQSKFLQSFRLPGWLVLLNSFEKFACADISWMQPLIRISRVRYARTY